MQVDDQSFYVFFQISSYFCDIFVLPFANEADNKTNDLLNNSNYENYLLRLLSKLYQNQSPKASLTMQLSFENNASMSLSTILDIKLEEYDHDDFWADMYDRPIVKYGLTSFTIFTLVFLTPYIYISLMFIHQKHFK